MKDINNSCLSLRNIALLILTLLSFLSTLHVFLVLKLCVLFAIFKFLHVSFLRHHFYHYTTNKSVGYDDFSPKVIQLIAPLIKQPLTSILNKSLFTGVISQKLKISVVTPIYKNEEEILVSSYRPVE